MADDTGEYAKRATMKRARIMIVDDHEVVRIGLKTLLTAHSCYDVVAEAATENEAIFQAARHQPDIILMDIRLAEGSGIDACARITTSCPQIRIIMLTSYADDEMLFGAIRAGAVGYTLKRADSQGLVAAIEHALNGGGALDPALTRRVFAEVRQGLQREESPVLGALTPREIEILKCIAHGASNRMIADELALSPGTVRNYVSAILAKLSLSNRAEAAAFAIRHHLHDLN